MLLCIVMTCLGILLGESYALRVLLFSLFRVSLAQDFNLLSLSPSRSLFFLSVLSCPSSFLPPLLLLPLPSFSSPPAPSSPPPSLSFPSFPWFCPLLAQMSLFGPKPPTWAGSRAVASRVSLSHGSARGVSLHLTLSTDRFVSRMLDYLVTAPGHPLQGTFQSAKFDAAARASRCSLVSVCVRSAYRRAVGSGVAEAQPATSRARALCHPSPAGGLAA